MSVNQSHSGRTAGVILAGGKSSRMGSQSKPFALLGDQPLLMHVINRLRPQLDHLLLSCEPENPDSPDGTQTQKTLAQFGLPLVSDVVASHRGPLSGLYSSLQYLRDEQMADSLMLCPCDAPFIPVDLVQRLQDAVDKQTQADRLKPVAVVSYQGELQPTFSLWHDHHLEPIEHAVLNRGRGGLKHMLSELPHVVVEWPESMPSPFYNINTIDQLDTAAEWLASE